MNKLKIRPLNQRRDATLLLLIIVVLLLILLAWWLFRPPQPYIASAVNKVMISITPAILPASSPNTFNVMVSATGYSDSPTPMGWKIEVKDKDPLNDDELAELIAPILSGAGVTPILTSAPHIYNWSVTRTLTLNCDGTTVKGDLGSSGESDPEIFSRFTLIPGPRINLQQDSTLTVIKCLGNEKAQ